MAQIHTDALYHSFTSADGTAQGMESAETRGMWNDPGGTATETESIAGTSTTKADQTAEENVGDSTKERLSEPNSAKTNARQSVKQLVRDKPLFCPFCDTQSVDAKEFQEHVFSDEHIKAAFFISRKIEREKRFPDSLVLPKKLENNKSEPEKKKQPQLFHCQTCMISCNGESAWNAHLIGQKHRKVLERQGEQRMQAKAQSAVKPLMKVHSMKPYERPGASFKKAVPLGQQDFQNYKEPLIGLEYVTEIQVMGQNTRYHCELCDCKFDGNLKFPHLVGAKHRFNVLKEKRPEVAMTIRSHDSNKKRSELTVQLRDEAAKLESEEGRKMVKLRVEKSPFDKVNASAARGKNQAGFGKAGFPSNRGQFSSNRGQNYPSRGQSTPIRGQLSRGSAQAGRGFPNTRGRGRGQKGARGGGGGRGGWSESTSFGYDDNSFYDYYYDNSNSSSQGPLLPKEAFRPMNEGQSFQIFGECSGFSAHVDPHQSFGDTSTERQDPYTWNYSSQNAPQPQPKQTKIDASPTTSASNLSKMLDLSKLVSTEDDAAVALQVSNALTQALLTYRMNSLQGDAGSESHPPPK